MKKENKNIKKIITFMIIVFILSATNIVYGITSKVEEYTPEYKNWLNLSDEEKEKTVMPAMYKVTNASTTSDYLKDMNNLSKFITLVGSSLESRYSLKDVIPENTTIKNQMDTNSCWAFSATGALESTLALKDHKNSQNTRIYDYSERHMVYATTRAGFLNNKINKFGHTKNANDGRKFYDCN